MMICRLLPILTLLRITAAQNITGFSLYNASSDTFLEPIVTGDAIDLALYGSTPLTIRVDVNDPNSTIRFMRIDWNDGQTVRTDGARPYYLGGDRGGDANEVSALSTPGSYSLQATSLTAIFQELDEKTIEFSVVNTTAIITPTATPVSIYDVEGYRSSAEGTVNGELLLRHKVTLGFTGILSSEKNINENPFSDLRLDVTFSHDATGTMYKIPGYFACDGDTANTGSSSGTVWLVHFRPDQVGTWTYTARYVLGEDVAVGDDNAGTSARYIDEAMGSFEVAASNKNAPDLRAKGKLRYFGEHYLQFEDGEYFLKAEVDMSNETQTWDSHVEDYKDGNPTWMGGDGKGIIGAINYLADNGANALSFRADSIFQLLNNRPEDLGRFDCSKTAQMDAIFDHAESKGLALQLNAQDPELIAENEKGGMSRTLFYREVIARFGHYLGLNWNMGMKGPSDLMDSLDYFETADAYKSPTFRQARAGASNDTSLDGGSYDLMGVSVQASAEDAFDASLSFVETSADANRKWVVTLEDQRRLGTTADDLQPSALWSNLMAGGSGAAYSSDAAMPDFRTHSNLWLQSRNALDFFQEHVPFWRMESFNSIVEEGDALCLADTKQLSMFVLYIPNGGTASLRLVQDRTFAVRWFDPRMGGNLTDLPTVMGTDTPVSVGPAPVDREWVALLSCLDCGSGDGVLPSETTPMPKPAESPQPAPSAPTSSSLMKSCIVALVLAATGMWL